MSLTVLFDLDDTLLCTNMGQFLPAYFKALGRSLSHLASEQALTRQINYAVSQMEANQDPGKLLNQIFAENFYEPLGTTETECRQDLDYFYEMEFPKLQPLTQSKPEAADLVNWCQSEGITLAIATNPVFPETATRQRIEWAGLNPDDFFLFTTYDDFHFTKPNLSYYAEVLGRLGWPESPAIMIGDSLPFDLLPIEAMGLPTFWIDPAIGNSDRAQGTLSDVKAFLEQVKDSGQFSLVNDPEVSLAILRATPAVIDTWLRMYHKEELYRKPSQKEWSFVEVLWHIADFEVEIYRPQWEQLLSDLETPLTTVDTSTWAEDRSYQSRDPQEAYELFLSARRSSLSLIEALGEKGLFEVFVDHSVFSETKVQELIGFSAKHDRIHLQQGANLLSI